MKKISIFLALFSLATSFALSGCQSSDQTPQNSEITPQPEQTQMTEQMPTQMTEQTSQQTQQTMQTSESMQQTQATQTQQKKTGLHIYNVNKDGSSQEITNQVGTKSSLSIKPKTVVK